jgi:hypothetical protein
MPICWDTRMRFWCETVPSHALVPRVKWASTNLTSSSSVPHSDEVGLESRLCKTGFISGSDTPVRRHRPRSPCLDVSSSLWLQILLQMNNDKPIPAALTSARYPKCWQRARNRSRHDFVLLPWREWVELRDLRQCRSQKDGCARMSLRCKGRRFEILPASHQDGKIGIRSVLGTEKRDGPSISFRRMKRSSTQLDWKHGWWR